MTLEMPPQQEPSDQGNEEEWEDVSESDEVGEAGMVKKYGAQRAAMLRLSSQNNTLFMCVMSLFICKYISVFGRSILRLP